MESPQPQRHFSLLQRHIARQSTTVLPITVPPSQPVYNTTFSSDTLPSTHFEVSTATAWQPSEPQVVVSEKLGAALEDVDTPLPEDASTGPRHRVTRIVAVIVVLGLITALYLVWRPPASALPSTQVAVQPSITTPAPANSTPASTPSTDTGMGIQVYITGAVQHPGVYTLGTNARIYELLQAAGGPLPDANLVAVDLAARLTDGEEVYITRVGESPPSSVPTLPNTTTRTTTGTGSNTDTTNNTSAATGQLLDINTASADEMRQQLHISSKTAQEIINYRQQYGAFTSVAGLQQVVSKTIYNKIKNLVTV